MNSPLLSVARALFRSIQNKLFQIKQSERINTSQQLFKNKNKQSRDIRLCLGVGPYPISNQNLQQMDSFGKDWIYIDKYIKQKGTFNYDAQDLPFALQSVDVIFASHLLEHFPFLEIESTLSHWYSLLKPGGTLWLNVPDLEGLCRQFLQLVESEKHGNLSQIKGYYRYPTNYQTHKHNFLSAFFGSHENPGEVHHSGYTDQSLKKLLKEIGFRKISIQKKYEHHEVDCLIATAIK